MGLKIVQLYFESDAVARNDINVSLSVMLVVERTGCYGVRGAHVGRVCRMYENKKENNEERKKSRLSPLLSG